MDTTGPPNMIQIRVLENPWCVQLKLGFRGTGVGQHVPDQLVTYNAEPRADDTLIPDSTGLAMLPITTAPRVHKPEQRLRLFYVSVSVSCAGRHVQAARNREIIPGGALRVPLRPTCGTRSSGRLPP